MGLLVTLYLIMINTYGSVLADSPENRGFGLIEIWMVGAQFPILLAMVEYGYILYQQKMDHNAECLFKTSTTTLENPGKTIVPMKNCCKNKSTAKIDRFSLFLSIFLFVIFNTLYWIRVLSLENPPVNKL